MFAGGWAACRDCDPIVQGPSASRPPPGLSRLRCASHQRGSRVPCIELPNSNAVNQPGAQCNFYLLVIKSSI